MAVSTRRGARVERTVAKVLVALASVRPGGPAVP